MLKLFYRQSGGNFYLYKKYSKDNIMLSIIIPALNEGLVLQPTIDTMKKFLDSSEIEYEIIIINDGSIDNTGTIANTLSNENINIRVINHPKPGGYGYSLKDGIKNAKYNLIAISDADGTYPSHEIYKLFKYVNDDGYDMAVGARTGPEYRGTFLKMPARWIFLWLCQYATGQKIEDINSGLRVFRKDIALKYINTISDGFSFTTTITLAALLNGYLVKYIPIDYYKRVGKSHVRYFRDSLRCLQIIVENILYYNPLKLFLLIIKFLLIICIGSASIYVWSNNEKIIFICGLLSVASFSSIFFVAVIGLCTDLIRITSQSKG